MLHEASAWRRREFLAAALAAACTTGRWDGTGAVRVLQAEDDNRGGAKKRSERDVPWLAEIQQPPERLPANAPQLSSLLIDDQGPALTTVSAWETRREILREKWLKFLGALDLERATPELKVLEEDVVDGCRRQLVQYESEPGLPVEGYLILPAGANSRRPVGGIVVLHSTVDYTIRQPAGFEGPPEKHFGLSLAKAGYATFSPRCFLWQGHKDYRRQVSEFQMRRPGSLGMAKMLWDAVRGVDVLDSLDLVDSQRLGCVGHSLGAKEVIYLAAFDPRIQAAVSSEGGVGIGFSNWEAPWYLGAGVKQPGFERDHHELLGLIAPRPFLLVGGESADGDRGWPYIQAALEVYGLYGEPRRVGQFNHRRGHAVPPEAEARIAQWLTTYV